MFKQTSLDWENPQGGTFVKVYQSKWLVCVCVCVCVWLLIDVALVVSELWPRLGRCVFGSDTYRHETISSLCNIYIPAPHERLRAALRGHLWPHTPSAAEDTHTHTHTPTGLAVSLNKHPADLTYFC